AADQCVLELASQGITARQLRPFFGALRAPNVLGLPKEAPPVLREFLQKFRADPFHPEFDPLPAWADRERIRRGQEAFRARTIPAVLVMLCKSLVEGYAAPSMAKILNLSGELKHHPFHRLMGTLQLLQDVGSPGSFDPDGVGPAVAKEMRLLHAGVRNNVARATMGDDAYEAFVDQYGLPINQEDMLGTILGFSLLVVEGLEVLGVPFTPEEAEDYYHVWRVYGHLAGIQRPGLDEDADAMPATLEDARAFYDVYHRHYVGATSFDGDWRERSMQENPDGVQLAAAHVKMIADLLPKRYRRGLGEHTVRMYVRELAGETGCARVGIPPVPGHVLLHALVHVLPRLWYDLWSKVAPTEHVKISEVFFATMIHQAYDVPITYTVPRNVQDLQDFVHEGMRKDSPA
ncbi:MAG TPA: oxygenase MpaB family protein, partial [Longimicrobiales bacterium]|nr:oxygenase MpaB family protein [Longimicrobiales bacterium]